MPPARKRGASSSSPAASASKRGISHSSTRDTTAANDAKQVLVKCRELRAHLIEKATSKTTQAAEDIPQNILEVAELPAEHVLEGMESVALRIAQQVMAKQGFSMDIPSRASSNQVYVKEWDRIVLGDKRSSRSFLNVKVRDCLFCVFDV
jgi:meiotic recombination protein SPO11